MKQMIFASMPMFVCGTMLVIILLELLLRPSRTLRIMAIFMGAASMLYTAHFIYFMQRVNFIPFTDSIYCTVNPLVFPLYYIYIKSLTKIKLQKKNILMLISPSLICGIAVGAIYLLMNEQETGEFIDGYLYKQHALHNKGIVEAQIIAHKIVRIVFALEIIPILGFGFKKIQKYDSMLEENYSSTEDFKLTLVKVMLFIFTGTSIISFTSNLIGREQFTASSDLLAIPSTLFSMLLFSVGYVGLRQKGIEDLEHERFNNYESSNDYSLDAHEGSTENVNGINNDKEQELDKIKILREQIETLMEEKKLYLQPQLKLTDLVGLLNSNRNYVYQAINVNMGISFSEYVNNMRVEYAKQLIKDKPESSFNDISVKSGFASSVSFYRNFKHFTGLSPQEYRNKIRKPNG